MKKFDYQKNAHIIWAATALILYLAYIISDVFLLSPEYSWDAVVVKTRVLQNLIGMFPFVALLIFSILDRMLKYVNRRIYIFLVLLLLVVQYMEADQTPLIRNVFDISVHSYGYNWEMIWIIYGCSIITMLCIPVMESGTMQLYAGLLMFVYGFGCIGTFLNILGQGYGFISLFLGTVAGFIFHYALFKFSDILTEENKSRICTKIGSFLFQPVWGKFLKWLGLDDDDEWMDELFDDEEFLRGETKTWKFENLWEDCEKLMLYALCQEEEQIIFAFQMLENMSRMHFLNKEGKIYTAGFIIKQIVMLKESAIKVNEMQEGYCSEEFINVLEELIQNRENPTFIAEVVDFAEYIYGMDCKEGLHTKKWMNEIE